MTTAQDTAPRLVIDLPPGFTGLTVTGDSEQDAAQVEALAQRTAAPAGQSRERMADHLGIIANMLADNRALLFGRFATRENTEQEPVTATVVLAMPELDTEDTDVSQVARNGNLVAAELERQYRQRHPESDVRVVELTAGPAMAAASAGEYRIPPEMTGQAETVVRPEFKAEFQLPTPDGKRLVIMAVTTDSEAGWPAVAADAMRIANSIRFEEPPAASTEPATAGPE